MKGRMNNPQQPFIILLIEDEQADAGLVKWALQKNEIQAELHHAIDGFDALAYLKKQAPAYVQAPRPDLILLDLHMPRMNGLEFLTIVKQDAALRDIPVVILSTSSAEKDVFASRDSGAADYFTKPMDVHQLLETIRILSARWINTGEAGRTQEHYTLRHSIELLESLPALPKIAHEILAIKLSTDEGNNHLLMLVKQDPAISAKIIGLANSPMFGASKKIMTVGDAVSVLGMNRIKMIALSFAMISSMKHNRASLLDMNQLWQHSMAIALAMDELAKFMPKNIRPADDEIYLAGFLHDIGFLVLDYIDPQLSNQFNSARMKADSVTSIIQLEAELLEIGHCELGALLAEHWNLSDSIIAVLRYHHSDHLLRDSAQQPLIVMAKLAEKILPPFDMLKNEPCDTTCEDWGVLGIEQEQVQEVVAAIKLRTQQPIIGTF